MRKLKIAAIAIGVVIGIAALAPVPQTVTAAPADEAEKGLIEIGGNETGTNNSLTSVIRTSVNVLLFILGALAVLMIIYGGFKYVLSGGDATAVTAAKNTILYAIVGLVVALLAYAIVEFVVDSFQSRSGGADSSGTQNEKKKGVGPTP